MPCFWKLWFSIYRQKPKSDGVKWYSVHLLFGPGAVCSRAWLFCCLYGGGGGDGNIFYIFLIPQGQFFLAYYSLLGHKIHILHYSMKCGTCSYLFLFSHRMTVLRALHLHPTYQVAWTRRASRLSTTRSTTPWTSKGQHLYIVIAPDIKRSALVHSNCPEHQKVSTCT